MDCDINYLEDKALYPVNEVKDLYEVKLQYIELLKEFEILQQENIALKEKILVLIANLQHNE